MVFDSKRYDSNRRNRMKTYRKNESSEKTEITDDIAAIQTTNNYRIGITFLEIQMII